MPPARRLLKALPTIFPHQLALAANSRMSPSSPRRHLPPIEQRPAPAPPVPEGNPLPLHGGPSSTGRTNCCPSTGVNRGVGPGTSTLASIDQAPACSDAVTEERRPRRRPGGGSPPGDPDGRRPRPAPLPPSPLRLPAARSPAVPSTSTSPPHHRTSRARSTRARRPPQPLRLVTTTLPLLSRIFPNSHNHHRLRRRMAVACPGPILYKPGP